MQPARSASPHATGSQSPPPAAPARRLRGARAATPPSSAPTPPASLISPATLTTSQSSPPFLRAHAKGTRCDRAVGRSTTARQGQTLCFLSWAASVPLSPRPPQTQQPIATALGNPSNGRAERCRHSLPANCRQTTTTTQSAPMQSHALTHATAQKPRGEPCGGGVAHTATSKAVRGTPRRTGANPRPAQDSPSVLCTRSLPGAPIGDSRGPVARAPGARSARYSAIQQRRARPCRCTCRFPLRAVPALRRSFRPCRGSGERSGIDATCSTARSGSPLALPRACAAAGTSLPAKPLFPRPGGAVARCSFSGPEYSRSDRGHPAACGLPVVATATLPTAPRRAGAPLTIRSPYGLACLLTLAPMKGAR